MTCAVVFNRMNIDTGWCCIDKRNSQLENLETKLFIWDKLCFDTPCTCVLFGDLLKGTS